MQAITESRDVTYPLTAYRTLQLLLHSERSPVQHPQHCRTAGAQTVAAGFDLQSQHTAWRARIDGLGVRRLACRRLQMTTIVHRQTEDQPIAHVSPQYRLHLRPCFMIHDHC